MSTNFTWAEKDYDLREFILKFESFLPLLVEVTDGYYGMDNVLDTFSGGDMYWLTNVNRQERAILQDAAGLQISIPLDYRLKFRRVLKFSESGEPVMMEKIAKSLEGIIADCAMSADKVYVITDGSATTSFTMGGHERTTEKKLGVLQLVDTYEDLYLVGNGLLEGLVHTTPMIMLAYVPIRLGIAQGFTSGDTAAFNDYMKRLLESGKRRITSNSQVPGNPEIMVYVDHMTTSDYTYIEPKNYLLPQLATRMMAGSVGSGDLPMILHSLKTQEVPDSLRTREDDQDDGSDDKKPPLFKRGDTLPSTQKHKREKIKPPRDPDTPYSNILSKLKITFKPKTKKTKNPKDHTELESPAAASTESSLPVLPEAVRPLPPPPSTLPTLSQKTCVVTPLNTDDYCQIDEDFLHKHSDKKGPVPKPRPTKPAGGNNTIPVDGSSPVIPEKQKRRPSDHSLSQVTPQTLAQSPAHPTVALGSPNADQLDGDKPSPTSLTTLKRGNGRTDEEEMIYQCLKEIPKELKTLTKAEVADALRLLGLGHYRDIFKSQEIDGSLLVDLSKEDLMSKPLNLSSFEATKLIKFTKQWRPSSDVSPTGK